MQLESVDIVFRAAGLANTKATAVVQSVQQQCFWISTSGGGVSRFDEKSQLWQTFTEADGLANPDVRSMLLTLTGELWFGTSNGASYYSPSSQQWQSYFMADGLPNNSVWSLLEDHLSQIWLGTNGGGLSCYNPATQKWQTYTSTEGLAGNIVQALLEDTAGNIWVGTQSGLSRLNPETGVCTSYYQQDGLANDHVRSLVKDVKGNIWVGTIAGLSCYQAESNRWQNFSTVDGLGSDYIQALACRAGGTLWAGTRMGISSYDANSNRWCTLTQQDGLTDNEVWGLLEDEQDRVWVATWGGGVSLYHPQSEKWNTYTAPSEFADTYALAVIKSVNKHVWIGTYGAISRYAINDGAWLTLSSAEGLPNNNVQTLAEDDDANVWVGTSGGLIRYQPRSKQWLSLSQADGLINNNVQTLLFVGDTNELWVGTACGLCCYQLPSKRWQTLSEENLSTANVRSLMRDDCGKLWIGTTEGLIVRHANNTWQRFDCSDGLLNPQVNALAAGSDDCIWIGTEGGLNAFTLNTGEWKSFTQAQGLTNNKVRALLFDSGDLWVACAEGNLNLYQLNSNTWQSLDALGSDDLTSLTLDADNKLWVASAGGGMTWIFRHGPGSGFIQHFTAGAQTFAYQLQTLSNDCIALGRPGEVAISGCGVSLAESQVHPVLHNPLVSGVQVCEQALSWVASDENGLSLVTANKQQAIAISNLPSRNITALGAASNGDVWIGTAAGVAVARRDALEVDKKIQYPKIPCGPVSAIAAMTEQEAYIGFSGLNSILFADKETAETRLKSSVWYRTVNGEIKCLPVAQNSSEAFAQCVIHNMVWSMRSGLWVATSQGLFHCSSNQSKLHRIRAANLAEHSIVKVTVTSNGDVCVLAEEKTNANKIIVILSASTEESVQCLHTQTVLSSAASIDVDDDNRLWMSCGRYLFATTEPI